MHGVSFKVRTSGGGNQFKAEQTFEKVPSVNKFEMFLETHEEKSLKQNSSRPIKLSGISFWVRIE